MVPEEEYAEVVTNGSSTHVIGEARGDDSRDGRRDSEDGGDGDEADAIDSEWDEESESEVVERPAIVAGQRGRRSLRRRPR